MYICMNCLNISLIDGRESGTRVEAGAGPKSRPGKPGIAEPGPFGALSLCTIALLGAKSLSSLLEVVDPRGGFLWQADILE